MLKKSQYLTEHQALLQVRAREQFEKCKLTLDDVLDGKYNKNIIENEQLEITLCEYTRQGIDKILTDKLEAYKSRWSEKLQDNKMTIECGKCYSGNKCKVHVI